ncbi:MAG TPA: hypothetical protein VFA26_18405 [Gemmataceae bacterium]|nr:hypothetical protein [Gemmataceae bacterium]
MAEEVTGVQATPLARGAQAQADTNIHFRCPRCAKPLESPAHTAGQKVNCPDCGQRLQIPQPARPAPPPVNRTIMATEEPRAGTPPLPPLPPTPPAPPAPEPILDVIPVEPRGPAPAAPTARRESCLECGLDITRRARVFTCPDCGSLFCSAGCYREHRYHAHPGRGR